MKTFNYSFQGNVTVCLDGNNNLLELTQRVKQFILSIRGDKITLYRDTFPVAEYPNSIVGMRDAYHACGFNVICQDDALALRVKVIEGESIKELIYDKTNHSFVSILTSGSIRVLLSTGPNGWSCTTIIDGAVNTLRGNGFRPGDCIFAYASELQRAFH